jgi:hypothetical protein
VTGPPGRTMTGMEQLRRRGPRTDGLAALAVLTWIAAATLLLGQALAAGDDMVLLQFEGRGAGLAGNFVAGTLVGVVLLAICVVAAVRVSAPDADRPGALLLAGVGLLVLAACLLVMAATQFSLAMSVADAAHVDGATAPGQVVTAVTGPALAAAAVPCVVVGLRRLRGADDPPGRPPV